MRVVDEDTDLAIGGLSISDVDAGTGVLTTTLHVDDGTLTVAAAGGAAVLGSGTDTVTLTGTLAQINITLSAANNVLYRGDLNFNGGDVMTVTTNDGGATGLDPGLSGDGTSEEDVDTVNILVNAVNDAPVNTVPGPQSVNEDTDLAITGLSVADVDAGPAIITVTLSVASGTLTVRDDVAGGLDPLEIAGNGTDTVTLTCNQAVINTTLAALNGVVYRGDLELQRPRSADHHHRRRRRRRRRSGTDPRPDQRVGYRYPHHQCRRGERPPRHHRADHGRRDRGRRPQQRDPRHSDGERRPPFRRRRQPGRRLAGGGGRSRNRQRFRHLRPDRGRGVDLHRGR